MWFSKPQEPKSPPSRGQTWFSKPKEPKSPLAKDIQKYGVEQSTRWRGSARRGLQVLREEKQHASTKVALAASEAARAKMEMKSAVTKAELKTVQVRATARTAVQREHKIRTRLKRVLIMADGQALARTLANWRLQANVQAARRRVAVTSAAAKETNWSSLFGGDQKDEAAAPRRRAVAGRRGQPLCAPQPAASAPMSRKPAPLASRECGAQERRPPRTRGRWRRRSGGGDRAGREGARRVYDGEGRARVGSRLGTAAGGGGAGTVGGSPQHCRRDGGAARARRRSQHRASVSSPRCGLARGGARVCAGRSPPSGAQGALAAGGAAGAGEESPRSDARVRRWRNCWRRSDTEQSCCASGCATPRHQRTTLARAKS